MLSRIQGQARTLNVLRAATLSMTRAAVALAHLPTFSSRSSLHLEGSRRKMAGMNRNWLATPNISSDVSVQIGNKLAPCCESLKKAGK